MNDVITVRVPGEMHQAMLQFKINWPGYIREALQKKIFELKRKNAVAKMDNIREKTKNKKLRLAEEVIKWRAKH
ncbi:MAG: hypothetical protein KJ655_00435 [Candidatus Thermoplasmatota archaeon]|nr:hypothetical protein [Candidatus Thermoplasmatota archaeon]